MNHQFMLRQPPTWKHGCLFCSRGVDYSPWNKYSLRLFICV